MPEEKGLAEFRHAPLVEEAEEERERAAQQQKDDDGISAQIQVVNLGRNYWVSRSNWARQKNLLSNEQSKLVILAQRMPSIVPNEHQSAKLLDIKAMVEGEGYRT